MITRRDDAAESSFHLRRPLRVLFRSDHPSLHRSRRGSSSPPPFAEARAVERRPPIRRRAKAKRFEIFDPPFSGSCRPTVRPRRWNAPPKRERRRAHLQTSTSTMMRPIDAARQTRPKSQLPPPPFPPVLGARERDDAARRVGGEDRAKTDDRAIRSEPDAARAKEVRRRRRVPRRCPMPQLDAKRTTNAETRAPSLRNGRKPKVLRFPNELAERRSILPRVHPCNRNLRRRGGSGKELHGGATPPEARRRPGGPASTARGGALMKKFTRQGLPDPNLRHRAWTVITGVDHLATKREGGYDALVGKSRADMEQIQESLIGGQHRTQWGAIERDLKRTFPTHYLFRDCPDVDSASGDLVCHDDDVSGEHLEWLGSMSRKAGMEEGYGKKALRRILRAYSVFDQEIGYCQGMNFISAMFLTFLPEEESFWMLTVVMNEEPYKLRDLFSEEMTGTHEVLYIAEKLIAKFLPDLYDHLENEQVHISMFVTQWLMTLYTSTFPFKLVARVWDIFLCDGWNIIYCTMLSLLEHAQQELLHRNLEQILSFLRGFPTMVDGDSIMLSASKIPLEQSHIQMYALEFRKLIESGEILVEEVIRRRFASPESIDGYSLSRASSRTRMANINKVHRFVSKLKRSTREIAVDDLSSKLAPMYGKPRFAVVLSNVLSLEECAGLIKRAKGEKFEDVLMRQSGTGDDTVEVASCRRSMVEDLDLASELFDRIVCALQATDLEEKLQRAPWRKDLEPGTLNATGLNDRLHFLRYGTGQFFAPHRDSRFRSGTEVSHITMQAFLNHNYTGGKTSFRVGKRFLDVKPKAGSVLLFDQDLRREECEVLSGRKFIVRSDVMYQGSSS